MVREDFDDLERDEQGFKTELVKDIVVDPSTEQTEPTEDFKQ